MILKQHYYSATSATLQQYDEFCGYCGSELIHVLRATESSAVNKLYCPRCGTYPTSINMYLNRGTVI
jgi:hypothetical protein